MTLIISAATPEFVLMVSDMRLSNKGISTEELSGKSGTIEAHDAFALYAYTGLAKTGRHETKTWLHEAFSDAKQTRFIDTVEAFAEIATRKFTDNLLFRKQALTVAISGYAMDIGPFIGSISNIEDDRGIVLSEPTKQFGHRLAISPGRSMKAVVVNGINQGLYGDELQSLQQMLLDQKPRAAVEQRVAGLIRTLSDDERTAGTVGKNLLVGSITQTPEGAVASGRFAPHEASDVLYTLDRINLRDGFSIRDLTITAEGQQFGDKLPRNARCWCRSGKKYKNCHGGL